MNKFSERIGAVEVPRIVQTDSISTPLRNSLWNFVVSLYNDGESGWWSIAEALAQFLFKLPVDELPVYNIRRREWIKERFYALKWYEVYDFAEFIARNHSKVCEHTRWHKESIERVLNTIFEQELSGYRFLGGELVPISNPAEAAAIDEALDASARSGLGGVHAHLVASLQLLGKRPDPDYRNSVKEAISAVESIAKQLGRADTPGLAGALEELSKKVQLHGALKSGFVKLYGYTSDESGIRHAILDEPTVGFDEAKYMVVACSAFVNYLAAKAHSAKLLHHQ